MIVLAAGGQRTTVSVDEANEILRRFRLESASGTVVTVDLSCRQWNQDALDVIEPFLKEISGSVQKVQFDDIIAGLMTDEGLSVTEKLADVFLQSRLTFVDLSDNAMGPRGLGRVGSLFAHSHVESLFLNNCGLGEASMVQLKEYLTADDGRMAKSLRKLELDRNMIGIGGAKEVGECLPLCTNLEHFSYNGCRPSKEGTTYICQGVFDLAMARPDVPLSYISLEDCSFGDGSEEEDGIIPFSKGLEKCSQLKYLSMRDAAIEADGTNLLVDALESSEAKLTHLLLDGCEFGEEGASILAAWLGSQNDTLRHLHLNLNEMGDAGVCAILRPLGISSECKIEDLSLEQNEIGDEGASALVGANLPNLLKLRLADNEDMPKDELKEKYGKVVDFGGDDDNVDDDGAEGKEVDDEQCEEDVDDLVASLAASHL